MIRLTLGVSAATTAAFTLTPIASALPGLRTDPAPAPLIGATNPGAIPGEYLVMLKDQVGLRAAGVDGPSGPGGGSGADQVAAAVDRGRRVGARVHARYRELGGYAATLGPEELEQVRNDPAVAYVAADQRYTTADVQPDADWGLDRIDQRGPELDGSYLYTNTGRGVTAYVVDTGVRSTHRDFTTALDGTSASGRVDGGTSRVDDGKGTQDCQGHGTHVAATIGGTVHGVAKEVSLTPVRVLDCHGSSTSSIVAGGLDWIVSHHAEGSPAVANLSLTNDGGADPVVEAAVERVIADGVTVVIAAGNGNAAGQGIAACSVSPSDVKAAIVVGATDRSDRRTGFSNYGACVDLYAPGLGITSAWADGDNRVATLSGTSMATPHVTGAVALYLENHPKATPAQVQSAILGAAQEDAVGRVSDAWPRRMLFAPQKVQAPAATPSRTSITSGTALLKGHSICSANRLYCLEQTGDDLALNRPGGRRLWHTGRGAAWTRLTDGGDLVSYNAYGQQVWSSGTSAGASRLTVTNRGNLAIVDASGARVWTSNPAQQPAPRQNPGGRSTLNLHKALYRGGRTVLSKNGRYSLALRTNGRLTLSRKGSGVVWSTAGQDADWLTLTDGGNLVLVNSDGTITWSSGTAGQGANRLRVLNNGKVQVVNVDTRRVYWTAD